MTSPSPTCGRGRRRPARLCCTPSRVQGLWVPVGGRATVPGAGARTPGQPGEGAGRCAHHQGAISANQRVLEIDPTGWGKRAAAWVCIAAIKREAILDLREQQLFVRAQGLCRALRSPLRLGDKKHPSGAAAAPAQEGGRSGSGSSCLGGEVQALRHFGWAPTISWVHRGLLFWRPVGSILGFTGGADGKEPAYQCRRHGRQEFDPWVGKIPWKRARQEYPSGILARRIPWTEEAGGLQSMGSRRGLKCLSVQGPGSILQEVGQAVEAQ